MGVPQGSCLGPVVLLSTSDRRHVCDGFRQRPARLLDLDIV